MDKKLFIRNFMIGAALGGIILSSRGCSLNKEKPTKEELDVNEIEFSSISQEEFNSRLEKELARDFDMTEDNFSSKSK